MVVPRYLAPAMLTLMAGVAGVSRSAAPDAADVPPATRDRAFAVLAPRGSPGGRLYAPFYNYVITPHAVVRDGVVYCAFQDTAGRPVLTAYHTRTKRWQGPVRASERGLGADTHGNPSLCIDRAGYLHVFYGCHGGAMRHTKSVRPGDIGAWAEQPSPTKRATYPQSMLMTGGRIFLFYRAGGHMAPWCLRISADSGKTWSDAQRVIEMRLDPKDPLAAAYAFFFPGSAGKTVHCFWNHKDDNAARVRKGRPHPWRPLKYPGLHEAVYRYNAYYLRRGEDGRWTSAAGKAVTLPVSKRRADAECMLYDSRQEFTFVPYGSRLAVDAQNRPYLTCRIGVVDWVRGLDDPKHIRVPVRARYFGLEGAKWSVHDDLPADWPAAVRADLAARGLAAYGDRTAGPWYIYAERRRLNRADGCLVLLYHPKIGYVTPPGGAFRIAGPPWPDKPGKPNRPHKEDANP